MTHPLPPLLDIQVKSYEWFLFEGLDLVMREVIPIKSNDENYELRYNRSIIHLPKNTVSECLEKDLTYSCTVNATMAFVNNLIGEIKEQEVFITELPFMTRDGTFIINGVERVIVSQLVRAPGVYLTHGERRTPNEGAHMVKIIPYRGAWLRFEYDLKSESYQVRLDSPRRVIKVPMADYLMALGFAVDQEQNKLYLPEEELEYIRGRFGFSFDEKVWPDPVFPLEDRFKPTLRKRSQHVRTKEDAQKEIWRKLHPTDPHSREMLADMLPSRFFDPRRYDLAPVGRYVLNQKLGVNLPEEITTLTHADILEAFRLLYRMQEYGDREIDDVDHLNLENRRVEHIGELLMAQFRKGLLRLERIVREKMMLPEAAKESPKTLVNTRPIIGVVKEFFGSSQMSQFMENTNPLAALTHKRRLSALGPKGLTREAARFDFRDVHHSHYGRICPIESPEGPNIGLISSLATFARVNRYGFIETPYLVAKEGRVTDEVAYLTAQDEIGHAIVSAIVPLNKDGTFAAKVFYARKGGSYEQVPVDQIDYMEVSAQQFISVTTSLIPFLEHDDPIRALMGSNMQRQAVPLLFPEAPVVGTGVESKIAEDAGSLMFSLFCGEVTYVDSERVSIRKAVVFDRLTGEVFDFPSLERAEGEQELTREKFDYLFSPPEPRTELYRRVPPEDRAIRRLRKESEEEMRIDLRKFQRSNQGTLINNRPRVRKGYPIIKGDLLADTSSTHEGELALGQNVLVAFMSWRGYNYEDAILVSERLNKNDNFTSIHIEKYECEARNTKLGPEKITREITGMHEEYLERNLDDRGIVRVGAEVKAGDILAGKITPRGESDLTGEEKLIRAVFGDKGKGYKNTPLKVPHGQEGVVIATGYYSRADDIGDLAARHKLISEDQLRAVRDRARRTGEKLDKILVDAGLLSRERVKELSAELVIDMPHNVVEMARVFVAKKRRLSIGDKMAGRHGNKGVVSNILPEEDMPFLPDGTPVDIVLNPLGVPSRMNIGQLLETHLGLGAIAVSRGDTETVEAVRKSPDDDGVPRDRMEVVLNTSEIRFTRASDHIRVMNPVFRSVSEGKIRALFRRLNLPIDGKTVLNDGMTGQPFTERVTVGVMYVMKLNHLVDDKVHARSTGSYALITQQPLGGKAQFGGQRFGEMEVWALEAYGAAHLLKEMLTVKSDDVVGRNRTYKAIVDGEVIPEPGVPESFHVMMNELKSLCLDVSIIHEDEQASILRETTQAEALESARFKKGEDLFE
jgi:DNA-directed RNA polymerase subunit beta